MAINWTPWYGVPIHRRLELLSVFLIVFCELFLGAICSCAFVILLCIGNTYVKAVCWVYLAFIYYDRHTGDTGGRGMGIAWMRSLSVWKHCMNYFPVDLVKTVDLSPDQNYLICIFPHGIISLGAGVNFGTSHSKWSELIPGIRPKCTTLGFTTLMPIQREILFSCGFSSASANSLTALLEQSNDPNNKSNRDGYTSNGVGLIVGGAPEAFITCPNVYKCYLKRRKGFIRIALETGCQLVPAISFGENEMYGIVDYEPASWIRLIQDTIEHYTKHPATHYNGRGFLQHDFGIIPRRVAITTVVGAPIHLQKVQNPTNDEINKTHRLFCTQLNSLFEEHKSKYIENSENVHLEFV